MTILDYCRTFAIISWSWLLILRARDLGKMLFSPHTATQYDVLWALQGVTSLVVIGFAVRHYVAYSSQEAYITLYVISIALALSHIRVVYKFKQSLKQTDPELSS